MAEESEFTQVKNVAQKKCAFRHLQYNVQNGGALIQNYTRILKIFTL